MKYYRENGRIGNNSLLCIVFTWVILRYIICHYIFPSVIELTSQRFIRNRPCVTFPDQICVSIRPSNMGTLTITTFVINEPVNVEHLSKNQTYSNLRTGLSQFALSSCIVALNTLLILHVPETLSLSLHHEKICRTIILPTFWASHILQSINEFVWSHFKVPMGTTNYIRRSNPFLDTVQIISF